MSVWLPKLVSVRAPFHAWRRCSAAPRLNSCSRWRDIYGATLDSQVGAPQTAKPRIDLRPMSCADGSIIIPLTRRPGGLHAYKFVLPAGHDDAPPTLHTHEGYDWAYVLNGTLRLVLDNQNMRLRPGEAVEFDTRTPHWFGATSEGPVEYLALVGRQGERAHVLALAEQE